MTKTVIRRYLTILVQIWDAKQIVHNPDTRVVHNPAITQFLEMSKKTTLTILIRNNQMLDRKVESKH